HGKSSLQSPHASGRVLETHTRTACLPLAPQSNYFVAYRTGYPLCPGKGPTPSLSDSSSNAPVLSPGSFSVQPNTAHSGSYHPTSKGKNPARAIFSPAHLNPARHASSCHASRGV